MSDTRTAPAVDVELVPARVDTNLDALEAYVEGVAAQAEDDAAGLDCTDRDNYRWAKSTRADLNRMAKQVKDERLRVKRAYMAPFDAFESRCKAVEARIAGASAALKAPIDEADEAWRERRRAELQTHYEEFAELLVPVVPLDTLMAGEPWLNRTCGSVKAKNELEAKVSTVADGWQALKDAGLGDALPDAERAYFSTLDLAGAIQAGRDAAAERERIEAMRAAVEPEPAPEPEHVPATWRPGPEDYERMAGPAPGRPDDPVREWTLTVEATKAQMLELANVLAGMGIHGRAREEAA